MILITDTNGNRGKGTTGQNGGKNDTDGFWNIHLSPNSISSVPFGPGHLTVWEHADAPGRLLHILVVYEFL